MAKTDTGKPFDGRAKVKMIATAKAPFHNEGEEFECHPNIAHNVFKKKGYAKFVNPEDDKDLANVDESVLGGEAKVMTKA
jgi:hypothetical protein